MLRQLFLIIITIFIVQSLPAHEGSVVCIHGFFRSHRCMLPLGNTFRNAGLEAYLWDYQSKKLTIEQHANALVHFLKTIAAKNPGEPIHFTTHSFGGIILRSAVNHPDCPQEAKIGRVVMLAPPNQGAKLGHCFKGCPAIRWLLGKKAGYQLITYTPEDMQAIGQLPDTMDTMVIAGSKGSRFFTRWVPEVNDGKVTVDETRLDTPHTHHTIYVAHSWIMTSRESIKLTKTFIMNGK